MLLPIEQRLRGLAESKSTNANVLVFYDICREDKAKFLAKDTRGVEVEKDNEFAS